MKLRAIVRKAEEGGYWAEVPALPGCATQGETMPELRKNLKEAIELWLEAGEDLRPPRGFEKVVELAV
jgi:predicted RNase H-like HicB family nuclease